MLCKSQTAHWANLRFTQFVLYRRELADAIADPSASGLHRVGDVVAAGPEVENVQQVTNALDQWLNQPMTIVLYDDGNQQDGYQIK